MQKIKKTHFIVRNNQAAFDHAIRYFLTQKKQCSDFACSYPKCYYWKDGEVCVVGSMLNKPEYLAELRGSSGSFAFSLVTDINKTKLNTSLLEDLQRVHDDSCYWDDVGLNVNGWHRLIDLAFFYDLRLKELTNAIERSRSTLESNSTCASNSGTVIFRFPEEILERMSTREKSRH